MGERQTVVERLLKMQSWIITIAASIGISVIGYYINRQDSFNDRLMNNVEKLTLDVRTLEVEFNHMNKK